MRVGGGAPACTRPLVVVVSGRVAILIPMTISTSLTGVAMVTIMVPATTTSSRRHFGV